MSASSIRRSRRRRCPACRRCTRWSAASISGPAPDDYLKQVIAEIKALDPDVIIPMHCSGDNFARAVRETDAGQAHSAGDRRAADLRRLRRPAGSDNGPAPAYSRLCRRHPARRVAGWLLWPMARDAGASAAELMDVVMWGKEPIGGPFTLIDHDGQAAHRRRLPRQAAAGLFRLHRSARMSARPTCRPWPARSTSSGRRATAVQPLFITVDPELDTPEQLKTYVALFHPRLIGLTGDRRQIRDVTHAYKVYFVKTAPAIRSDPNINHSSVVYVVGVDGNYVGFFPPGTPADRMVAVLQSQLAVLAKASPG